VSRIPSSRAVARSSFSGGWKSYLTDDEPPEAVVFCPSRAAREFGGFEDEGT
jgi:hypothetical protein